MNKITILISSIVFSAGTALASTGDTKAISTQELAGVCGDQSNPVSQRYCDIYGQGVFDGYLVTRHPRVAPEFICVIQPAPSRREVMGQFIDWVKANPAFNNAPAADALLRFLAVRFPCKSSSQTPENAAGKIIR